MNEKFFDLKKEKQDRMINAALKIFAIKGYEHASTDDIVKEAGISKGLLFHYFISKIGLYTFVYDYSVKYLNLEISTGVSGRETDYFKLLEQIYNSQLQVMKSYPYMVQFLNVCRLEQAQEALEATKELREVLPKQREQIMQQADFSGFKEAADVHVVDGMLERSISGLLTEKFRFGQVSTENLSGEIKKQLALMKSLCYAE